MNNRRKLLIALGAGALAVMSLLGYLVWSGYQQEIHAAEITTRNYAAIMEARLDATLRRADASLQELVNEIPLAALSKQAEPRYARKMNIDLRGHMINFPELAGMRITDANGERLYTSDSPDPPRTQLGDRDYFRQLRDNPGADLVFSEVLISRVGGRPSVIAARALRDTQGAFRGTLFAVIELEHFRKLFQSLDIGAGGSVSVYRSDTFSEVVRWPLIDRKLNTPLPPDSQTRKIFAGGKKTVTVENFSRRDGIARIYSYKLLDRYPFFVAVGIAHEQMLADWRARSLAVGLSALLLLGLLASLVVRLWRAEARQTQTIAALAKSEERLQRAQNLAHIGNWEWNLQTGALHWEKVNYRIFGLPAETVPSTEAFFGTVHPDDQEFVKQSIKEALEERKPYDLDMRIRHPDGTERVVHAYGEIDRNAAGEPIMFFGTVQDITERKRVEEALRESESRMLAVFRASPIGITISRVADGKILEINDAALQQFGRQHEEVIGHTAVELGTYANPAQRVELVQRLRSEGKVDRLLVQIRNFKHGAISSIEISARPIELRGEQCLVAMMVDVTERKRQEEAHLQAQKLESLGTLAGGIAHDFNNILAAIRGNADLAARDVGPDHIAAESLEEIRKASTRASELVRRIMAFGRPREAQRQVVDLGAVVDEVLQLLRSTLPAGIAMRKQFANDTPSVLADAGQIHEAIVNLTTNAAYAIGPGVGSIEYRLESVDVDEELAQQIPGLKPGRYARLSVTDSGCGMEPGTLERIFDAFYTTKPVGQGTGLGLSMVHGTMRSHGGAVTVESTPGKGSSFALYFPAAGELAVKEEQNTPAQNLCSSRQRVLYVDDEEALVLLASRVLSRLGHEVASFTDPVAALQEFCARPQDFDVVVTDLSMPYMSGHEFAREVLAVRPGMPVLMTTGYIGAADEDRARAAGIRELILKPATMDELGRVLDRLFCEGELERKAPA